jgi:hypothetical protein
MRDAQALVAAHIAQRIEAWRSAQPSELLFRSVAPVARPHVDPVRQASLPPAPIRYLGEPADAIPREDCKWAAYISHHQAAASRTVLWLGETIEKKLMEQGKRPTAVWTKRWLASPEPAVRRMNEGVRLSRNFLLFLTKEVLTREWCLNEIRTALKHRKNVILVYETNEDCGSVSGTFAAFYGPELKKALPHSDDYDWLVNRNSYVAFHDRGQHVDVMLSDPECKNGILDQMELEEAESATTGLPLASAPDLVHHVVLALSSSPNTLRGHLAMLALGAHASPDTSYLGRRVLHTTGWPKRMRGCAFSPSCASP